MADWVNQNLQIFATLGSALAVYIGLRHAAKKDVHELRESCDKRFEKIDSELQDIKTRLTVLETFMSIVTGSLKISQKERTDP